MPYLLCRVGTLAAIRWTGPPDASDVDRLIADTHAAKQAAGSVRLLAVIPAGTAEMPAAPIREYMQRRLPDLVANVQSIDTVFEGTGTKVALVRTLLRGLALLSKLRFESHFHSSVEEALGRLEPKLVDRTRVEAAFRAGKILTGPG